MTPLRLMMTALTRPLSSVQVRPLSVTVTGAGDLANQNAAPAVRGISIATPRATLTATVNRAGPAKSLDFIRLRRCRTDPRTKIKSPSVANQRTAREWLQERTKSAPQGYRQNPSPPGAGHPEVVGGFLYRRLPSLLSRRFPNLRAVHPVDAPAQPHQQPWDARPRRKQIRLSA